MNVLGINAVFHDPAAALVVDGVTVAAAEEERFSRRKHGKPPVAFSTWELPEQSMAWCLEAAGIEPAELDAVAYSYDPELAFQPNGDITAADWEGLRTLYARRAPAVPAHGAAGARPRLRALGAPPRRARRVGDASPRASIRAACWCSTAAASARRTWRGARSAASWRSLAAQRLPHSLGLLYEELTAHLGFRRSSDEYKVMAMASYGEPEHLERVARAGASRRRGGFTRRRASTSPRSRPRSRPAPSSAPRHAALACSVQRRLEEVLLELAGWLHERTGDRDLVMAGGVALNCVANSRLWRDGPFERVWVQPAAGDSGTALGAALQVAHELGDAPAPMPSAALGRGWDDAALAAQLETAEVAFERPDDVADAVAEALAGQPGRGVVPGPLGVRPARARSSLAARRPAPPRQPGEAQRHQGPRAVPAGRADGARRAGGRDLRRRPDPEPVHALHAPRARRLGGAHPRRRARRRHRPDPDRRPRARAADGALPRALRGAHRRTGGGQHEPQHRRAARWSTIRATRSSASAPRRSTCWRSGRTSSARAGVAA